jgi:hypothetical protein
MASKEVKTTIYEVPEVVFATFCTEDLLTGSDLYANDFGNWIPEEDLL